MRITVLVGVIVLVLGATACRPAGPPRISALQLGRTLNSDNSVGGHTTQFRPGDTIYAAVLTSGSARGTIVARWLYAGRLVSEASRNVNYTSDAYTEFHIQNSSGFPPGDYRVEILVEGKEAAARNFRVQK